MPRGYSVVGSSSNPTTSINVIQLTAPSTAVVEIMRVWIEQSTSTTSAMADAKLCRLSAAGTTNTTFTAAKMEPGAPTAGSTVVTTSTAGTATDTLAAESFNILNGWLWIPVPEERPVVAPSGIVAVIFTATPTAATYRYGMTFQERG